MMRHIAIALTAAIIAGAPIGGASARGGHGGMGHGSFGHFSASRPGGFTTFSGHSFAFHNHFFGRRFAFRHRFRHRFFFVGAPYAYGYDDDCYVPVWTRWGRRWQYVCY